MDNGTTLQFFWVLHPVFDVFDGSLFGVDSKVFNRFTFEALKLSEAPPPPPEAELHSQQPCASPKAT